MIKNQSYEFLKGFQNGHINIGFGSYGQVKLARNIETKQLVAIKLIYNKNAKDEIAVHKRLDHPNIIKLLNYYYQKEKHITYMVLEYADGGSLFDRIKNSHLSKDVIRKIFRQVCQAVHCLHINNFMHRDVKPQNILLTKNNDAKLCDFGFAALLGQRKTLCGTYEYMAPEMIQNMNYDYKIDIWALGILLFQMIEGVAPFRGQSAEQVLSQMKKNIYFSERFEKEQINLIKTILRVNPSNRPSIPHILEHKYFQKQKIYNSPFSSQQDCKIKLISVTTIAEKPKITPQVYNHNHTYNNNNNNKSTNELIYTPAFKPQLIPSHLIQPHQQPFNYHTPIDPNKQQYKMQINRPISSNSNFTKQSSFSNNNSFQNWRKN